MTVTGTVDDVRPFYHSALAAVVPLRVGGGTRLKILEAIAASTPVISTALGAEGLAVTSRQRHPYRRFFAGRSGYCRVVASEDSAVGERSHKRTHTSQNSLRLVGNWGSIVTVI